MTNISLIVCIIGGIVYLFAGLAPGNVQSNGPGYALGNQLGELGKWAFVVGLAAFLFGH